MEDGEEGTAQIIQTHSAIKSTARLPVLTAVLKNASVKICFYVLIGWKMKSPFLFDLIFFISDVRKAALQHFLS